MLWSELPLAASLSSVKAATQVAARERTLFFFAGGHRMSLSSLFSELIPLCEAFDDNLEEIGRLFQRYRGLAEYEVARFYAGQFSQRTVAKLLNSDDPRDRRRAADLVRWTFSTRQAGGPLRQLLKDPNAVVRTGAYRAVRALGLDDVALPDNRFRIPVHNRPRALGGYNPTGWAYGLYCNLWNLRHKKTQRRPKVDLASLDVPKLANRRDVLKWLQIGSMADLQRLVRPGSGTGSPYVSFQIPKANGQMRTISAPRLRLRRIQRQILHELLTKLPTHPQAHGFVKKRSVVSNAQPHQGAQLVLKLDLKDFFPTISYYRVCGLLRGYGLPCEVAESLAALTTHRPMLGDGYVVWPGVLPQGAPTSPVLANLVCRRLDARLAGLAKRLGAQYTRYADDLTFSFAKGLLGPLGRFFWWVNQICQQEGFAENATKRKVLRPSTQQRITGIVVNQGLAVPRVVRRTFRAILHNCRVHGIDSQARGRRNFAAYLLGWASYIRMVQPELGNAWLAQLKALLNQ